MECFAYLHNPTPAQYKRFDQGVQQLLQEGVVQRFELPQRQQKVALLAAVGPLQFDIVKYRLESEYGAASRLEPAPWSTARWIVDADTVDVNELYMPGGAERAVDSQGEPVLLFADDWQERYFHERNPDVTLQAQPVGKAAAV